MNRNRIIGLEALVLVAAICGVGCGAAVVTPHDGASPAPSGSASVDAKAKGDSAAKGGSTEAGEGGAAVTKGDGATRGFDTDDKKAEAKEGSSSVEGGVAGGPMGPPPPPEKAAVSSSSTPLAGGLSQKDIGDVLTKNAALFNDCYTIGAAGGPSFTGTVTVKATLGPTGNVSSANVVKSTAKNNKVDACVVTAFKKIKFPPPQGGGTSVITFPMEFNGVEVR